MPSGNDIDRFIKPHFIAFDGYSARKFPQTLSDKLGVPVDRVIKLDANENLYGCSPRVNQVLAGCSDINIYPDAGQTELRKLLQEYTGISANHIVVGSGSGDLIDLILRLLVEPGDEVISCVPAFSMFRFSIEMYGGKSVAVLRDKSFAVSVDAVKSAISNRTRVILLDNPNNPTGRVTSQRGILELINIGLPIVIDEAYIEFGGESVVSLVSQYDNLMVLRTFSKWAGLAGLRVGYGIFPTRIADYIMKIKLPYNVNVAAIIAVRESLRDIDYLMGNIRAIIAERERLFTRLQQVKSLKPFPSQANFILCAVVKGSAIELRQRLQEKGILIRYFNTPLLRNYVRISVGKPEHSDALISALQQIEEEING
ncbi:MAG: histidinol-phosphate transaminase [Dehalococcoidales bacterium]|nr:histidinol-phosphate transaminase [Dehalococcoidales bacterium]